MTFESMKSKFMIVMLEDNTIIINTGEDIFKFTGDEILVKDQRTVCSDLTDQRKGGA